MAQLGFAVTLIERNQALVDHVEEAIKQLKSYGTNPGLIRQICSEFHLDPEKNTQEVNQAIQTADVLYSYPWPEEVESRLQLFQKHAKIGSVLILYGSGVDDFYLDTEQIDKHQLEVIGISTNEIREEQRTGRMNRFKGLPAFGYGSNWIALKKK